MGGGFHEREAEFGVVLSTTKLLGEPVGAENKVAIPSQSKIKYIQDVSAFVFIFIWIFILKLIENN